MQTLYSCCVFQHVSLLAYVSLFYLLLKKIYDRILIQFRFFLPIIKEYVIEFWSNCLYQNIGINPLNVNILLMLCSVMHVCIIIHSFHLLHLLFFSCHLSITRLKFHYLVTVWAVCRECSSCSITKWWYSHLSGEKIKKRQRRRLRLSYLLSRGMVRLYPIPSKQNRKKDRGPSIDCLPGKEQA